MNTNDPMVPGDRDGVLNGWKRGSVVVGIGEGARQPRAALRLAAQEANQRRTGVLLVHACTPSRRLGSLEPGLPREQRERRGLLVLRAARKCLLPLMEPGLPVQRHIFPGTAIEALLGLSESASLIVLQRRQVSALRHVSTGSTSSNVAARAACPVAVVRQAHDVAGGSGVVVGVDDDAHAGQSLLTAFSEAQLRQSALTAVHVWSRESALTAYGWQTLAPEQFDRLRSRAQSLLAAIVANSAGQFPDVVLYQRVFEGPVVPALLQAAQGAELLVLGRHGRSQVGSLALGGVARSCLGAAGCPVLVAPTCQLPRSGGAVVDPAGDRS